MKECHMSRAAPEDQKKRDRKSFSFKFLKVFFGGGSLEKWVTPIHRYCIHSQNDGLFIPITYLLFIGHLLYLSQTSVTETF